MEVYKLPELNMKLCETVGDAAQQVFKECAAHLFINFERFRDNHDEASLMQIRIGMRRTRVAMQIFKPIIPPEIQKRITREFRYFGNLLGEARDMDVFLSGMLDENCPLEEMKADYAHLRYHAELMREDEYQIIEQELMGGRFEKTFKRFDKWRLSDWSSHLGRTGNKLLSSPLKPFVLDVLEDGRMNLLSKGAYIEERSTQELHRVRKYVKRCRYHLRFFSSLIHEGKLNEGYDILVEMQDTLGHVNDVKEGMLLLSRLSADVKAEHVANILTLMSVKINAASDQVADQLHAFQQSWHRFEDYAIQSDDLL
ncbi:CHAD domain-containing protein [Sneathiella sp. P13V-1]|uniref:CHAD domain-containing protein n=1 Tax=Sneathiella sp. P13V-1 TaxID=2697366 RepID=UPI00187B5773|nr:CHAD domain-containing protein [Sneathiella sp. P13V-1]MBE7636460.1 CHAD domain-containing protein [Sneathiella sp. P13V-1]